MGVVTLALELRRERVSVSCVGKAPPHSVDTFELAALASVFPAFVAKETIDCGQP